MEKISRDFTHKGNESAPAMTFGHIDFEFPVEGFLLNGQTLAKNAVIAILNHGWQILQDTYAGYGKTKTPDEAIAAFENKLAALLDGTIGISRASTADPVITAMRWLARQDLKKSLSKPDYKKHVTDADDASNYLDAFWAKNESTYRAKAAKKILADAAYAKMIAELAAE